MKTFYKQFKGLCGQAWCWTLLAVMLLIASIWVFGPLLAVADNRFWESPGSRLLTAVALLLAWASGLVLAAWRARVRREKAQATEDGQRLAVQEAAIAQDRKTLLDRFKDAERVLRQSSLYGARNARSRQELPWYLLIGPQSSGKTSLLDFSGLDFPLNQAERKLTRDTRGTRACDWYFADQAVILDTAGRLFSQSRPAVDASAWTTLLGMLRGRRRMRPINGVLVTVPVDVLLDAHELRVQELAAVVRSRLQDVHRQLQVEVPVYLMLTKADALQGFDEFFDQLSREESDQVLGATFEPGQNGSDPDLLKHTFLALLTRLNDQVVSRVHQERGVQRRGLVLDFPHQLGRIGHGLCLFVELAFAGNRYQRASQLRGYYFTRAPHVIDAADAVEVQRAAGDRPASGRLPVLHAGRARFIHDLLGRIIFPESDLALLDKDVQRRIRWSQRGVWGVASMALMLCATLWATGFSSNHERLERLRILAGHLQDQHAALKPGTDAMALLEPLNTAFEAAAVFPDRRAVGLHERSGLYQGEQVNAVLAGVYHAELERHLLPPVARLLEARIKANLDNREKLLASLRAYLMLNLTEHRDTDWLQDRVAVEWSLLYVGDAQVQGQLNGHLKRLLKQPFVYPLDTRLVAEARQVLRSESLATVVYRVLREQARSSPDYRLAQHVGSQAGVFTGTDYPIPGFFTRQGYQQYFVARGSSVVTDILRDNWVLGETSDVNPMALRRLLVELEQLYFRDYADHWSEALGQVSLQPFEGARQAATQVGQLGAANSPLLRLLAEVRDHTRFALPAESVDPASQPANPEQPGVKTTALTQVASAAIEQARDGLALPDTAKKSLQRRFEPLHRLLDENDGPAPDLLPVLQALDDVQLQLATLARSGQPEGAAFEMARARMGGQRDALGLLRVAAAPLPQPVGRWFTTLAEDSWSHVLGETYRFLNQRYQEEVYSFYGQALDKRYPFHAHSGSDVALPDFREFFKVRGIADRFFDSYLKPFVSGESGQYRLRSVDGQSVPMSRAYLDQMSRILIIRKSFFAHGPDELQVQFKLEPYTLDPVVSRAEFRLGDQSMEYRHGPIVPTSFSWPIDAQDGRASLVLDRMAQRPIGIEKNTGPWSLFRLLDLMQSEYLKGRDVLLVKADVGGLRANYLLLSQRSPNPFDVAPLRRFRLPAQL